MLQQFRICKIYDGYRYQIGTGTGNFSDIWWYRKNLVPEKSLGTGIGKNWYRKKVSEPVSEKFGTKKKYRYQYRKYLVPEKVSVLFKIVGTVTLCLALPQIRHTHKQTHRIMQNHAHIDTDPVMAQKKAELQRLTQTDVHRHKHDHIHMKS